jgi:hypothetical protein
VASYTAEHLEVALLVLERGRIGRESLARQERGHQPATGALPCVQGLRHRAEIGLGAGGERRGQRERSLGLRDRQLEEPRAGSRHGKHAYRRGRMPPLLRMARIHAAPDGGSGLVAGGVGEQQFPAAGAVRLGGGDERRNHYRRHVTAHALGGVVVVERMRGGAVDPRRFGGGGLFIAKI